MLQRSGSFRSYRMEQKEELIALFDEFEAFETPESKFAHAMDNLQPLMLNNSNGGADWKEHEVTAQQVYGRQSKTRLGSETLFEVVDSIIQQNIANGQIRKIESHLAHLLQNKSS